MDFKILRSMEEISTDAQVAFLTFLSQHPAQAARLTLRSQFKDNVLTGAVGAPRPGSSAYVLYIITTKIVKDHIQ